MKSLAPLDQIDSYEEPREMSPLHDTAMAKKLYKEVWGRLQQRNKSMLSMPQSVYLLYSSPDLAHKQLVNGKVVVLPSAPSVLYWIDDSRTDFQFRVDILEAYYAQSGSSEMGIKVGEAALEILTQRTKLLAKVEPSQVVIFRLESEELILLFPLKVSHMWKKSLSALIRSFLQSYQKFQEYAIPIASPRDPQPLDKSFGFDAPRQPLLGNVYDITTSENPGESTLYIVWINIKLTCITPSGQTNEEYLVYDKNQDDLSQSTNDLMATVSDRLDCTNEHIFRHFLEELELLEGQRKQRRQMKLCVPTRYQDEVFASFDLSLSAFIEQDHQHNWVNLMQCDQFEHIYRRYLDYDVVALRRGWNNVKRKTVSSGHPCRSLFRTMQLTNLGLQVALGSLLSSSSGEELLRDIGKLKEITESEQEESEHPAPQIARAQGRSCETCVIS